MSSILVLVGSVTACLAVGMLGSFATRPNLEPWYAELRKPPLNPPNKVFGPAWGFLFILMGVSLSILIQAPPGPARTLALVLFGVQLAMNTLWSVLFFTLRAPAWALIEIVPFLACVAGTGLAAARVSTVAGALFIPYVAWVTFATYLNVGIVVLNPRSATPG